MVKKRKSSRSKRSSVRSKRRLDYKKILLFLILLISAIGCIKIGLAYMSEREEIQAERTKKEKLETDAQKEKSKVIVSQRDAEKKKFGVDSQKVWNALNTYDYENGGKKEVFLTFDDGPSLTNTPNVLKILKDNNVKATFFVIGKSLRIDGAGEILKQTYNDGMAIANHTYSHDYSYLYPNRTLNLNNFVSDLKKNEDLIRASLGMKNFSTRAVRCPGGQISWKETTPLSDYLVKNNMSSIDWNSLNGDAEGKKKNAEELYNFAVKSSEGKNLVVLLMHDTYGKEETVKSLDRIIKYYKSKGYEFKTLI